MSKKGIGAYDDELSDDELRALNESMGDDTLPPAEDDDNGTTPEIVQQEAGQAKPPEPVSTAEPAAEPVAAAVEPQSDAGYQDFINKHAGKSTEELLKIAFQQNQRAARSETQGRKSQAEIEAAKQAARSLLEKRKENIEQRREDFKTKLADDPDAAAAELNDRLLDRELTEAEQSVRDVDIDAAIELASSAIPEFGKRYKEVYDFGLDMNYSPEEMNEITDGRNLVTLYLASIAGKLIKSGVMDVRGQFNLPPAAVAETDPRLAKQGEAVTTLSSTPGKSTAPGGDDETQLANLLGLSDADFAKIPEAELETLLRRLGG